MSIQKVTIVKLQEIPSEVLFGGIARRNFILDARTSEKVIHSITKGVLKTGSAFDWHHHEDLDEVFVILGGAGSFLWENQKVAYSEGHVISIPAYTKHRIEASGSKDTNYLCIKTRSKHGASGSGVSSETSHLS